MNLAFANVLIDARTVLENGRRGSHRATNGSLLLLTVALILSQWPPAPRAMARGARRLLLGSERRSLQSGRKSTAPEKLAGRIFAAAVSLFTGRPFAAGADARFPCRRQASAPWWRYRRIAPRRVRGHAGPWRAGRCPEPRTA